MANQEHVDRLKQGFKAWNQWRQQEHGIKPDLFNANLRNANLRSIDLRDASLIGANLKGADLRCANLKGADLRCANLKGADLQDAGLSSADLDIANLFGSNLSSSNLSSANLRNVNLSKAKLRSADLSKADLRGADLSKADLSKADLRGADLSKANLSDADLRSADLSKANLRGANLRAVQALEASFQTANLTEACIEDWHINSKTNLQEVVCECIFTGKYDYKNRVFTDRLPHDPTKTFAPGDFAKLVQESLNTVNLIFREGLDWRSFAYSFQQLQVQYADEQIAIQTIENKGNGAVVIRLAVSPDADKGNIEQSFWRGFEMAQKTIAGQYDARLEDKDKHINQLFTLLQQSQERLGEVPKLMADNLKSETYNTTVHGPVGNLANKMQDNAAQHATQNIGTTLDEITTLIRSMRGIAEAFPQAQRTEAIDHLEDIETELKQPPEQHKKNRVKAALLALVTVATAVSGAVAGANEFATQVQELSDKLGIPLPIEQVQPQQSDAVDVGAVEQE